ncbi:MAG: ribosome maturation factor RimP [Desulfovibrionaceae bacterium]|nr:ribosome maturation factor RimP [Desulfovibrionaceae bacterium]
MTDSQQKKIAALASPLLASLGLDLWGLEFIPARRTILRLYIESAGNGAGINECEKASRLIGLALDAEEIIPSSYILEISTPGLEKPLFTPEQLATQLDKEVEIILNTPVPAFPGRKKFSGLLREALPPEGGAPWRFGLRPQGQEDGAPDLSFDWTQVKKARLLYIWPEKPGVPDKSKSRRPSKNEKPKLRADAQQTTGPSSGGKK